MRLYGSLWAFGYKTRVIEDSYYSAAEFVIALHRPQLTSSRECKNDGAQSYVPAVCVFKVLYATTSHYVFSAGEKPMLLFFNDLAVLAILNSARLRGKQCTRLQDYSYLLESCKV